MASADPSGICPKTSRWTIPRSNWAKSSSFESRPTSTASGSGLININWSVYHSSQNTLLAQWKFYHKDFDSRPIIRFCQKPLILSNVADPKLKFRLRFRIRIQPKVSFGFESGFESRIRIRIRILDSVLDQKLAKTSFFVLKFLPSLIFKHKKAAFPQLPWLGYETRCAINLQDSDPDPLVRGTDPRIRFRTKKSRINNTAYNYL